MPRRRNLAPVKDLWVVIANCMMTILTRRADDGRDLGWTGFAGPYPQAEGNQ